MELKPVTQFIVGKSAAGGPEWWQRRSFVVFTAVLLAVMAGIIVWFVISTVGGSKAALKAFQKVADAKSFHAVIELELRLPESLKGKERPVQKIVFYSDQDIVHEGDRFDTVGTLDVDAIGRGMVLFATGDIRIFPDRVAFRLDEIPTLLNPSRSLMKKWTYVNSSLLSTVNKEEMGIALRNFFTGWAKVDVPSDNKKEGRRFIREVTPEQERILAEVFRQGRSGNKATNVVSRLLLAYEVKSVEVWIPQRSNDSMELIVEFVHPVRKKEGATLRIALSDYGKKVILSNPPKELTVRPEVFSRLFGSGEISSLEGMK